MTDPTSLEPFEFVIKATNILETRMKHLIAAYIGVPSERQEFFLSFLMNNSNVSFAAKTKIVLVIAKQCGVSIDRNAFHTILSRRNAFAHQDPLETVRVITDRDGIPDVKYVVESIKGSGEMEIVTQEQAYREFVTAYFAVGDSLAAVQKSLGIIGDEA